ncbi:hypothetical protein SODALDRAFT_321193 [Sodiomyces alkalinus F11]|uniref:Uncharacterized protein n=1 Tax=Sodiomyces alkalinus (strain CBS 110278 / VKM F-3762 / F11) TaxID=1314773 RepID=A0A3N2PL48_SODAK|nr:hypothetical protein SODALDRAFT_321193 [Sodiomyces alkalinus F11]ROT35134.1 hypothetical protein SODALDRAFT_321193 [Sodiomyces alkalinus F11]
MTSTTYTFSNPGLSSPGDDIQYPPGFGLKDVVAWGITGLVVLDAATKTVITTPFDPKSRGLIEKERQIYERLTKLAKHEGILPCQSLTGAGFVSNTPRIMTCSPLSDGSTSILVAVSAGWLSSPMLSLSYTTPASSTGDVTTANVFLDDKLNVKLADFAGSSIDSLPLLVSVTVASLGSLGRIVKTCWDGGYDDSKALAKDLGFMGFGNP